MRSFRATERIEDRTVYEQVRHGRSIIVRAETIEQVADGWNSGSFQDKIWPGGYVKNVADAYARPDLMDPTLNVGSGIGGG